MQKSAIKCHFCDNQLWYHHPSGGQYNCHAHGDMNISYHYEKHEDPSNLTQMTFIFGHRGNDEKPWTYHHLKLSYRTNQTMVYFFGDKDRYEKMMKDQCLIYSVDHIVPGITAQNAEQHLTRLLKLATFS